MNIYEAADKELAELLGWTNIKLVESMNPKFNYFTGTPTHKSYDLNIPRWTLDDGECLRLAVEYGIHFEILPECVDVVYTCYDISHEGFNELFVDHADKLSAVRYAIVQAVIAKLKAINN